MSSNFARSLPCHAEVAKNLHQVKTLRRYLMQDKKVSENGKIRFVFLRKIGKAEVANIAVDSALEFVKTFKRGF